MNNELTIELLRKYSNALHTQYQLHGDYSISGRASYEAPTIEKMATIREAHLNIIPMVKRLITTMQLNDALEKVLVCYRLGKRPSDKLLDDISKLKGASSEYSAEISPIEK